MLSIIYQALSTSCLTILCRGYERPSEMHHFDPVYFIMKSSTVMGKTNPEFTSTRKYDAEKERAA